MRGCILSYNVRNMRFTWWLIGEWDYNIRIHVVKGLRIHLLIKRQGHRLRLPRSTLDNLAVGTRHTRVNRRDEGALSTSGLPDK